MYGPIHRATMTIRHALRRCAFAGAQQPTWRSVFVLIEDGAVRRRRSNMRQALFALLMAPTALRAL